MASLVFLGSPAAAVPSLDGLVAAGHEIRLVVSQPDRRRGRGGGRTPSPVKRRALELGLPVTDDLSAVAATGAELGVVVAYGRLVPAALLEQVPMVNVHFSLLPRWRGAAPVERAILAGDPVTGVCLMWLEAGLDTGPVIARREVEIGPTETAAELTDRLARAGADLLVGALAGGRRGLGAGEPQAGEASYAAKIDPDERRLRWSEPAELVVRRVRIGRAHTWFRGRRLLVERAEVDSGSYGPDAQSRAPEVDLPPGTLVAGARVVAGDRRLVVLRTVQPPGRQPMPAADWWRGARPRPGERFDEDGAR